MTVGSPDRGDPADQVVIATEQAIDTQPPPAPRALTLHPARPNPMARSTLIAAELPVAGDGLSRQTGKLLVVR